MKEETNKPEEILELAKRLREQDAIFVIISKCTQMPYVICDEDTFDDEILIFEDVDDARRVKERLEEKQEPVHIGKVDKPKQLLFYTTLYTMGVNAFIANRGTQNEMRVQLQDFLPKPDSEKLPDGKVWIENPELHLTALYFVQELRKTENPDITEELKKLREEVLVDFQRGTYVIAMADEKGLPMLKQKNGDVYQPVFTDIMEFNKFNVEKKFKPAMVEAEKISNIMAPESKGVVVNPLGVNLPLQLQKKQQENN